MKPAELEAAAVVAERACDLARAEILPRFRDVAVEIKSDGSPVTEADRAAERVIRATLAEAYPSYGLLGEEYGEEERGDTDRRWIIDPIDGTIGFSRGIPLFGTLIALVEGEHPVMGLIDLPTLGERYVGWLGGGCRCNGKPVQVSREATFNRALVSLSDPLAFAYAGQRALYERMGREFPLLRGYTDCFGHAQVICGRLDAMVDVALRPWDAAATQLLVVEAGGACFTRPWQGPLGDRLDIVFGSPPLVEQIASWLEV